MQAKLASAYNTVDDVDAYLGLLIETHQSNALVGPTLIAILKEQFQRLRDGDRFWYEAYLDPATLSVVQHTKLSDIILRVPTIGTELQPNVFALPTPTPPPTPTPRPTRTPRPSPTPTATPTTTPSPTPTLTPSPTPKLQRFSLSTASRTSIGEAHQSGLLSRELSPGSRRCQSASRRSRVVASHALLRHIGTSARLLWANKRSLIQGHSIRPKPRMCLRSG